MIGPPWRFRGRCKEKLNTLAISVMNQWPGVRLRVIEGWDEGNHHSTSSLHYEGRAVDITTSDKDRSKYGMLARLAVEAGFDWVYYESRAHIHCSVKSDSSQTARTGGCFSENATVVTPEGRKKITAVQPGDSVLAMNEEGDMVFSEVLMFLDRNSTETRLTPSQLLDEARVTFARNIEAGDWLLVVSESGSNVTLEKVVLMEAQVSTGVYAPLTKQGNVIVDGILASCYAVINDQSLAHWAFSPIRFVVNLYEGVGHAWRQFSHFISFRPLQSSQYQMPSRSQDRNGSGVPTRRQGSVPAPDQGVHWYASFLYATTKYLIPSHLLYGSG
ncbi:unnamed protein product [Allacma fusca]|uniref:Uncharacterized protein n=1 Tax=Allacma fusca TaxID=39272 RepID=A0A8J2JU47_9HEXA|nr:unnamed protein product [Allacma fusca]